MPVFSENSKKILKECHEDLQRIMNEVIKEIDIVVLCGHRGEEEQNEAYANGHSKAKFGQSKHNHFPALAIDVAPYPLDWNNIESFEKMGEVVMRKADELGIKIKWGRDFKGLKDYPHFELI